MSKKLIGLTLALVLFMVAVPASAAGLTQSQISAIIGLLQSFGAEQSVINNVSVSLGGGTPNNSGGACIELSYNLFSGSTDATSGGQVTKLQRFLGVSQTGYFGPETEAAVQRWQAQNGVVSSGSPDTTGYGYVGTKTRAAMARGCGETVSPIPNPLYKTATIDQNSLIAYAKGEYTNEITITGTAANVERVLVSTKTYTGKSARVVNGRWSVTLKEELPVGSYSVQVSNVDNTVLTTGTLIVKTNSSVGNTDWPSLTFSPFIKAGDQNDTWAEGLDIDGLVIDIKNDSLLEQQITFPTNCWYTYKIYDRNTGKLVFDLASQQRCMRVGQAPETTFTLARGESKSIDFAHQDSTYHLPPGNYIMKVDINSKKIVKEAVQFLFNVAKVDGSPSCEITSDKTTYSLGDTAIFSWTSKNARNMVFLSDDSGKDNLHVPGNKFGLNGSQSVYINVLGNPYVMLKVYGINGWSSTCKATVNVLQPTGSNPAATIDSSSLTQSRGNFYVNGSASNATSLQIIMVTGNYTGATDWNSANAAVRANSVYNVNSTARVENGRWVGVFGSGSGSAGVPAGIYTLLVYDLSNDGATPSVLPKLLTRNTLTVQY